MVQSGCVEHGMMVEVFHDHFNATQNEHVWCGQAHKTIDDQTKEVERAGRHFAYALW